MTTFAPISDSDPSAVFLLTCKLNLLIGRIGEIRKRIARLSRMMERSES